MAILASGGLLFWSGSQLGVTGLVLREVSYSALVSSGAVFLGLAIVLWWVIGLTGAFVGIALKHLGHARLATLPLAVSPGFMKRLAAAVIGVQLLAAPGAHAAGQGSQVAATSVTAEALSPYFSPATGSAGGGAAAAETPRPAVEPWWKPSPLPASPGLIARQIAGPAEQQDQNRTVTVVAGDSLWDIAAKELGSLATDVEIAGHWPKWYAANRNVIGDDPSQLLPGMVLTVPTE